MSTTTTIDELAQTPRPVRVVIDAMGGDFAPLNEIQGAIRAIEELSADVEIVLVGREADIRKHVSSSSPRVKILHTADVVSMSDEPSSIVKSRRDSSLYVGLDLVRNGHADAFVSSGNTGGVMATATLVLGRIPGASRPTIGSFFPTMKGSPTLLVDVGANVDSKPQFMHDFAVMGSVYTELMLGVAHPTVGLLNVGEEEGKGTEAAKETHALLKNSPVNFYGNVEGRDILKGTVDVVVCDGFEGNIVLKFAESILGFLKHRFVSYANKGLIQKLLIGAFKPVLKRVLSGMDYQEYGGVPLLGVRGVVIIGHGSGSPLAIKNMILKAEEMVRKDVNGAIQRKLELARESKAQQ